MKQELLTNYQVSQIRRLIRQQEIKKCKKQSPDIYEKYKADSEFWDSLADTYVQKLLESDRDFAPPYAIESRGNRDGKGYRLELQDEYNKEKFFIDYTGEVGEAEKYTPPKGLGLSGFEKFVLIMIPVYLVLLIFFCAIGGRGKSYSNEITGVIILGIINLILAFIM
ncbi:MAG: hypothetical protein IJ168_04660 [Eubacterium sp.]|nr:hypothetical protein [Eubacterium sp.]